MCPRRTAIADPGLGIHSSSKCAPAPVVIEARQRLAGDREDIPRLEKQVTVERLAGDSCGRHCRLHLIVPHERDWIIQVVEEQSLRNKSCEGVMSLPCPSWLTVFIEGTREGRVGLVQVSSVHTGWPACSGALQKRMEKP